VAGAKTPRNELSARVKSSLSTVAAGKFGQVSESAWSTSVTRPSSIVANPRPIHHALKPLVRAAQTKQCLLSVAMFPMPNFPAARCMRTRDRDKAGPPVRCRRAVGWSCRPQAPGRCCVRFTYIIG